MVVPREATTFYIILRAEPMEPLGGDRSPCLKRRLGAETINAAKGRKVGHQKRNNLPTSESTPISTKKSGAMSGNIHHRVRLVRLMRIVGRLHRLALTLLIQK